MSRIYFKYQILDSAINGKGIFCTKSIQEHELIFQSSGIITLNRSFSIEDAQKVFKHSISIDENTIHCPLPGDPLQYINHSCNANAYVSKVNKIFAKKNILPGEEITIDYSFVDADIFWRMPDCNCKEINCRQLITSSILLPRELFVQNLDYIPRRIRKFNSKFYCINPKVYKC